MEMNIDQSRYDHEAAAVAYLRRFSGKILTDLSYEPATQANIEQTVKPLARIQNLTSLQKQVQSRYLRTLLSWKTLPE